MKNEAKYTTDISDAVDAWLNKEFTVEERNELIRCSMLIQ